MLFLLKNLQQQNLHHQQQQPKPLKHQHWYLKQLQNTKLFSINNYINNNQWNNNNNNNNKTNNNKNIYNNNDNNYKYNSPNPKLHSYNNPNPKNYQKAHNLNAYKTTTTIKYLQQSLQH